MECLCLTPSVTCNASLGKTTPPCHEVLETNIGLDWSLVYFFVQDFGDLTFFVQIINLILNYSLV